MSSAPLTGKVAVITGGSKGIGKATVLRLAKDGASVVINYSSDGASAEELVTILGNDRALAVKANVSDVAEIERLVKQTIEKFGKIDILIPNAGTAPMKDLEQTTEEDFDYTIALNVKGPYFLCQVSSFAFFFFRDSAFELMNSFRKPRLTWHPAPTSSSCRLPSASTPASHLTTCCTPPPKAQSSR